MDWYHPTVLLSTFTSLHRRLSGRAHTVAAARWSPEASHHVVLVFGTILSQLLVGALRAGWEWEAVGHLEGATVIKSQQLTSHKLWQMLLAVFYDFQHHLQHCIRHAHDRAPISDVSWWVPGHPIRLNRASPGHRQSFLGRVQQRNSAGAYQFNRKTGNEWTPTIVFAGSSLDLLQNSVSCPVTYESLVTY